MLQGSRRGVYRVSGGDGKEVAAAGEEKTAAERGRNRAQKSPLNVVPLHPSSRGLRGSAEPV